MKTSTLFKADLSQVIAVQDLPDSVTGMIQEQISRLSKEYSNILNCRVNVTVPSFHQQGLYQIQIVFSLPDRELTIDREPIPDYYQEDIYVAIWSAFDLARQKLKAHLIQAYDGMNTAAIKYTPQQPIRALRRCRGYSQG